MLKELMKIAIMLAVVTGLTATASADAQAATIASTRQGMQQWKAFNGKLIMIAGTYQDTERYKRSLTFLFEEKPGGAWLHVPIMESEVDHTLTWFSVSSGETTVEDAVVSTQGDDIYLIIASSADKNGIKATRYKLATEDKDFPDGPAYLFKPIANHSYPNTKLSVESILKKETAIK